MFPASCPLVLILSCMHFLLPLNFPVYILLILKCLHSVKSPFSILLKSNFIALKYQALQNFHVASKLDFMLELDVRLIPLIELDIFNQNKDAAITMTSTEKLT